MIAAMGPDEAADFYRRAEEFATMPLWHRDPPPEPRPLEVAHVWRWPEFQPLLLEAAGATGVSSWEAERRALTLRNPGLQGQRSAGATQTIGAALQLLLPGEVARAHRHSFHALRFVLQGRGAFTVVNGHRVAMEPGDLVLTPGMCWHDHGHDGEEPMIWMDVLDSGIVHSLRGGFYEEHPDEVSQQVLDDLGSAATTMRVPGEEPAPAWRYPWAEAFGAVRALPFVEDPVGCGPMVEYVNPHTGRSVLPTLACHLHRLPAGMHTRARRETPSSVCLVMQGSGRAVVGGRELRFAERDLFVLPGWTFHELEADGVDDLVFFRVSEAPVFEQLGYFHEQRYAQGGGFQPVTERDGALPASSP